MNDNDLSREIRETIQDKNGPSVGAIGDDIGSGESTVYKWGLAETESGHPMPITKLIPLMRATRNFRILRHIAHRCGFALIKIPFRNIRARGEKDVQDLLRATGQATNDLIAIYNDNGDKSVDDVKDALWSAIEEMAGHHKGLDRHTQAALALEGEGR